MYHINLILLCRLRNKKTLHLLLFLSFSVMTGEAWTQLSSAITGLMLAWVMFRQYFPHRLRGYLEKIYSEVDEFGGILSSTLPFMNSRVSERLKRSEAFSAIQNYLSSKSTKNAKRLKADVVRKSQSIIVIAWKRGYLLYGPPGTG